MTGPANTMAGLTRKPGPRGQRREDPAAEAEARKAARDVMARREARPLSVRTAAALPGDAGPGKRLPADIRTRLEGAFGADLGGLRIHDSAPAAALARGLGARAFAAGPHLVFGAGAYRPHTGTGLSLIAHETAHAIQQGATGPAPRPIGAHHVAPQREPDEQVPGPNVQAGEGMTVNEKVPEIWDLILVNYKTMKTLGGDTYDPKDKNFIADLDAMQAALDGGVLLLNTPNDASGKLATFLKDARLKSFRGRCMGFDLLANSGEHAAAMTYLMARLDIEQLGYNAAFGAYFSQKVNPPLIARLLLDQGKSPYVKGKWTAFQDRFESYLKDPRATPPARSPIFGTHGDKDVQTSVDTLKLNQAQYSMLQFMQQEEDALLTGMRDKAGADQLAAELGLDADNAITGSPYITYLMRLSAANSMVNASLKAIDKRDSTGAQVKPGTKRGEVRARLSARFGMAARQIYTGARQALGMAALLANKSASGTPASEKFAQQKTAKTPEITAFLTAVTKALSPKDGPGLFALAPAQKGADPDKDIPVDEMQTAFLARLPGHTDFQTRRDTFVAAIRGYRDDMAAALAAAPVKPLPGEDKTLDRRNTLLFALVWSDWLASWIQAQTVTASPDGVAATRYVIANALGIGAQAFGHDGLTKAALKVHAAKDFGLSYAIIPKDFEKKAGADFTQLTSELAWVQVVSDDGAGTPYVESLAVSTANMVRFFQFTQMIQEIAALNEQIAAMDKLADERLKQDPWKELEQNKIREAEARAKGEEIPGQVNLDAVLETARDKVPVPELWEAPDGHIVMNPADAAATAPKVQMRHPSMRARFGKPDAPTKHAPIFKNKFVLRQEAQLNRVYFWVLPPLDPIWAELKSSAALKPLIDKFEAEVPTQGLSASTILLRLQVWVRDTYGKDKIKEKLHDPLDAHFKTRQQEVEAKRIAALRALTRVNRKIALDNLRDFLTAHKNKLEGIFLPDMFGRMLRSFVQVVQPKEDRDLQLATLMLEAVDEIAAVVEKHPNYDAISYLLPPVTLALSLIRGTDLSGVQFADDIAARQDDPKAQAETAANMGKLSLFEPIFTDLDARHAKLAGVMKALLTARAKSQKTWTLYASPSEGLHTELSAKNIKPGDEYSAFVMALWASRDVKPGEGTWSWDKEAQQGSPLDQAAGSADGAPAVVPKVPTDITGTRNPIFYRLDKIHRSFEFIPAFDATDNKTARLVNPHNRGARDPLGGLKAGTPLVTLSVANMVTAADGTQTMTPLRTVVIGAGDAQLLTLLASVIDTHSRNAQLQELAKTIEAGVNLALDLAEFIPGYGQAIMVARIAANIAIMIQNGELDEMKDDLINTPIELVDLISADFMANLDGELLWKFLFLELFGSTGAKTATDTLKKMSTKAKERQAKKKKSTNKGKKSDKYFNLAKALAGIGFVFADALLKAQTKAGIGINSAAARIASNDAVAPHIGRIDVYAAWISLIGDLAKGAAELAELGDKGGGTQSLKAQVKALQKGFDPAEYAQSMTEMFEAISEIELPAEVVPTALLVEVAIDFLLSKAGNKKVKFVYEALRLTGMLPRIAGAVEEYLIKGSAADPNLYWREHVRDKLAEPFAKGRDELVATLMNYSNSLFLYAKVPTTLPLPGTQITDTPLHIPDASAETPQTDTADGTGTTPMTDKFSLPGDPRHPHPGPLPDEDGQALPDRMRQRLERGFGHDLGHVRLHDGPGANNFVTGTGAAALASGSNVFVREDLDLDSPRGDHVLRHEIAHVLQQTGPRPLEAAGTDPARPIPGQPGRGVRMDPGREMAAEEMARASRRREAEEDGPLPIRGGGPISLAPAFTEGDMLTALRAIKEKAGTGNFTEKVLDGRLPLSTQEAATAYKEADRLMDGLSSKLNDAEWLGTAPFGGDKTLLGLVRGEAVHALNKARKEDARKMVARVAYELPKSKWKGLGTVKDKYALNERAFMNILTGYVYEQAGIRLVIDLDGKKLVTVKRVRFASLHLGRLRAMGGSAGPPELYRKVVDSNPDDTTFKFKHARAYFKIRFPERQTWKRVTGKLVISDADRDDVIATYASAAKTLDADKLPKWSDYAKTSGGGLGLRVERHGVLTRKIAQTDPVDNTGRESHHVPQFLLAEFYSGTNKNPLVSTYGTAKGAYWTPGFTPESGSAKETERPGAQTKYKSFGSGDQFVDFDKLSVKTNRGNDMPAVSLAAVTHKQGSLHLPMAPPPDDDPDDDNQSSAGQGFMMLMKHRENLVREVGKVKAKLGDNTPEGQDDNLATPRGFKTLVTNAKGDPAKTALLETATFNAMRASYAWMVEDMTGWLDKALTIHEKTYYALLAAEKLGVKQTELPEGGDYTPPTSDAWKSGIKTALAAKNKDRFGKWYVPGAWS